MLCAVVTALLLVATQTPLRADSIWDKAVDLAKAAEHLVPGSELHDEVVRIVSEFRGEGVEALRQNESRVRIEVGSHAW